MVAYIFIRPFHGEGRGTNPKIFFVLKVIIRSC